MEIINRLTTRKEKVRSTFIIALLHIVVRNSLKTNTAVGGQERFQRIPFRTPRWTSYTPEIALSEPNCVCRSPSWPDLVRRPRWRRWQRPGESGILHRYIGIDL